MPTRSSDILERLDKVPGLDWGNFEEAGRRARVSSRKLPPAKSISARFLKTR